MKGAAVSTVAGATLFHGVFRIASSGEYVRAALGKDSAGNVVAGEGTVLRRADGTIEPVIGKDTLVKLQPGDTVYEKEALHDNPDGTKSLIVGDHTTTYNQTGQVTEISNSSTKTKITAEYVENPVTHDSILSKYTAYKPDGSVDSNRNFVLDNGVYFVQDGSGFRHPMGKEMTFDKNDGTVTFRGSDQNSSVGMTRKSGAAIFHPIKSQCIQIIRLPRTTLMASKKQSIRTIAPQN